MDVYPLTVGEIVNWFRSRENALASLGITMAGAHERHGTEEGLSKHAREEWRPSCVTQFLACDQKTMYFIRVYGTLLTTEIKIFHHSFGDKIELPPICYSGGIS